MDLHPRFDAWWALLLARIDDKRAALPRELCGVLQLEAPAEGAAAYLRLDGRQTRGYAGYAADADSWIELDDAALGRFLRGEPMGARAMRVFGSMTLARALFGELDDRRTKTSWLGLRVAEAGAAR